jgi:2-methylcitrate dehydratase PrpD
MNEHFSRLCTFCSEMDIGRLPGSVVDQAKLVLLDTLGVIVSGSHAVEVDRMFTRFAAETPGNGCTTCAGRSQQLPVLPAILVNGMAGSNQEWEEGNSRAMGHPAIQLVPALIAEGERTGISGSRLLQALISGYEASCRISRASSIRRGLHPTGTWGVIGSAIMVALLRGRSPAELVEIADIASSYAFSPYVKNSFVGKNVSSTFAAMVNFSGFLTNDFFDSGIHADPACLEMTFSKFVSDGFNPAVLSDGLGESFAIAENYIKPYPTCRFTHPTLEALRAILQDHPLRPSEVDSIRVSSFKAAAHSGSERPANVEAMRFSIPYLVAVMLIQGRPGIEALSEEQLADPHVAELASKVDLLLLPEYDAMRPLRSPARVEIELKDGSRLVHEVLDCLGDPENPVSRDQVRAKFRRLAEPALGSTRAEEFVARMQNLEQEQDFRGLTALLRPVE